MAYFAVSQIVVSIFAFSLDFLPLMPNFAGALSAPINAAPDVYTIGFVSLVFIIYQLITETSLPSRLSGRELSRNTKVLFTRVSGVFILGGAALFLESRNDFEGIRNLVTPEFLSSLHWVILALAVILAINIFTTAPDGRDKYPQLKFETWHSRHFILNSITWLAYLFSYEWILRGPLLTEMVSLAGTWQGVAINTVFYSLIHAVKGRKEMIASLPVGVILCSVTLYTGSFLAAFILHGAFALAYEYKLVYLQHNPRYKSVRQ